MHSKRNRSLATIVLTVTALVLVSAVVFAEEFNFTGTWRGEYSGAAGAPGGAPRGGAAPAGGRGGAGGGMGGNQKITLRVKAKKDKASGNFTMGSGDSASTFDINNGKIDGNKMTFKTGLSGTQIYTYEAVLDGETMTLSRAPEASTNAAAPAGRGGGGRPQTFTLMRDKK